MRYKDFEAIMSKDRLGRYLAAVGGITRKAMKLYRLNLQASQGMFTIISCFEVALRNAIDKHYKVVRGNDWLKDAAWTGGALNIPRCGKTPFIINNAVSDLGLHYSHPKLIAKMDFGFWRYMFARHQYTALGRTLLAIFPAKPRSTPVHHYDNTFVFGELEKINGIRNRIAHHEPICFSDGLSVRSTTYARQHYRLILNLFNWMSINESALLYGLDHMNVILDKIDDL
ncbi:CAAX protease [Chitinophaga niabensis]|uniref:Abi-like protein n=1 Tax=Chitinophaga niabensis TaxID=536979 RepID=A0A1N6D2S3_9BACT|nr:CAAX protease [Chitinophaga niabensis]SIN64984.1 hypothetical protein SAMN04488055_0153 [Chitinophaga niabensis]